MPGSRLITRPWSGALARLSDATAVVTSGLAERRDERRAAHRRVTRRRVLIAAGIVSLLLGLAALVLASPVLAVRAESVAISVSGPAVDPAAVSAVVDPAIGVPLARLDVSGMTRAVGELPGVREVTLHRAWPNGLTVEVVARYPVAAVPRDGRIALLDSDGVQVGGSVDEPPEGLPVVAVPPGAQAPDSLRAVLTVLGALPSPLLTDVAEAGASSPDAVWFTVTDGSRVEWGNTEAPELKTRVLEVLRQRPAAVYDVSAPTMPVTR